MKTLFAISLGVTLLLSGCSPALPSVSVATAEVGTVVAVTILPVGGGGTQNPFPTPQPATAIPSLSSGLSPSELKYRLLAQFPNLFFCDPDYYPVARADEGDLALQHFPELQSNTEEFRAILNHNGLSGIASFTDAQKLLVYREHKKLAAIQFVQRGDEYQFQLKIADNNRQGFIIKGLIDGQGTVSVQERQPSFATCPICLAAHSQIDTPNGPKAVEDLRVGDPVWTADKNGKRILGTILRVVRVLVPSDHQMDHILLEDGRELWASPGHPTTDGRTLADLKPGDLLGGARIVLVELVPYDQPATFDLLPSGATGFYWADGILIGSTLASR
jgi:Hint domain